MNCKAFQNELPELVLNPAATAGAAAREHMADCPPCEEEYTSLVASIAMMDAWKSPEPSPFFDQKLAVLLREEEAAPRLGFFARLREHLLFNTGRQFRPAVAGALLLIIMLGGGGYARFESANRPGGPAGISATVNDLQILDRNAQALQEMDQLLQDDDSGDDAGSSAPS